MTIMLPVTGGAVDMSGVVGWLMRRYDTVLAEYQRYVTGDPGTLRQTAAVYRGGADRAAGIAVDLVGRSRTTGQDWQGAAYQAFDGAVTRLGGRVDVTEHRLRRQATAVETAATALEGANKNLSDVRTRFSAQAQLLVNAARAVPTWQLGTVLAQARRFGDEAVGNAKAVHTQLGGTLSTVASELLVASGAATTTGGGAAPGTPEQARAAAKTVREVLDGDAAPSDFRKAMTELRGVTDRVHAARAAGQQPSAADTAYLSAFYKELGARVYELPAYIKAGEHEWDTFLGFFGKTEPGFSAGDQQTMMNTLGNGVVSLSHQPDQLSPALRDLVTKPAGTSEVGSWPALTPSAANAYQAVGIPQLDRFEAMRDMLGAADPKLAMGTEFSTGLTQRVGEMADVTGQLHDPTNKPGPWDNKIDVVPEQAAMHDKPRMDGLMGDLLGASTRNHAADAAVMGDATTMQRLSTYDWTDQGAAAAKVVDWVPGALASGDPATQQMARESYLTLAQTVTDTGTGAAGDKAPFAPMLRGMDTNEALSQAFARNNAANIGLFAHTTGGADTNLASMQLSSDDARHMIMLGSYTPEGRDMTTLAAQAYQQHQLDLAGSGEVSPELAGRRAGNVIGLTNAGMENAIWEDAVATKSDADAANKELYQRQIGLANLAKDIGKLPLSTLPGIFGVVYDQGAQAVISQAMPAPEAVPAHVLPENRLATPFHNPDAGKFTAAYDVASHVYQHNPGAVPAEALVATSPTDPTPRVVNAMEVSSPFARAQNDMVEWARAQPAYREYVDTFHEQVNFAYRDNTYTQTVESITNDIHGRRPHQ